MTDELVAFLRARLDEDTRAAQDAGGKPWRWEQHHGDMCNDPTCEYGELATDDTVLMNVHAYDIRAGWQGAAHIERQHPARVLAEVETKRQIIAPYAAAIEDREALRARMRQVIYEEPDEFSRLHRQENALIDRAVALEPVIRVLALPFADHPDYCEEWRP